MKKLKIFRFIFIFMCILFGKNSYGIEKIEAIRPWNYASFKLHGKVKSISKATYERFDPSGNHTDKPKIELYEFDDRGNLINNNGIKMTLEYIGNNVTKVKYDSKGYRENEIELFEYDSNNEVIKYSQVSPVTNSERKYDYDSKRNLIKEYYLDNLRKQITISEYRYSAENKLEKIIVSDLVKTEITYAGNTEVEEDKRSGQMHVYKIDNRSNVVSDEVVTTNHKVLFTIKNEYDKYNNLIKVVTADKTYTYKYTYDSFGNVLKKTFIVDGKLTAIEESIITYQN